MKTLISLFVVTFLSVSTMFADDAAIVANWTFPITTWGFPGAVTLPALGAELNPKAVAYADSIANFNAVTADFDATWTSLSKQGAGYPIANPDGLAASNKGAADFTGAFKVVYDENNMYILMKYTDDNYLGTEAVEIMWAPYLKIDAIAAKGASEQAAYCRYAQFGAYKATYGSTGFSAAMILDFNAAGLGNVNWGGTDNTLSSNLYLDNIHTPAVGSAGVVKGIYTIGFQALTGNAYTVGNARPDFNTLTWRALNAGKGISFDIKVNDNDADDAKDAKDVVTPAAYWWNSTVNDGYAETYYSGFLGVNTTPTAVNTVNGNKNTIFGTVTSTKVALTQAANVEVFNSIGKRVLSLTNAVNVNLTNLNKGVYIIRANNETLKFAR